MVFITTAVLFPVMNAQGKDEEEVAALMGAKGFTIFRTIYQNISRIRFIQPSNHPQDSSLSASARAKKRRQMPLFHSKTHIPGSLKPMEKDILINCQGDKGRG